MFRLEGGRPLSEREFVQFASLRMNWFKPTEAQQLLRLALERGLVQVREGQVTPMFEVAAIDAPMDYRPSAAILAAPAPEPDVFTECLNRMMATTGADRRTAVAAVNAIQERMDVDVEVAALIHARRLGIDVEDLIGRTESSIRKRKA